MLPAGLMSMSDLNYSETLVITIIQSVATTISQTRNIQFCKTGWLRLKMSSTRVFSKPEKGNGRLPAHGIWHTHEVKCTVFHKSTFTQEFVDFYIALLPVSILSPKTWRSIILQDPVLWCFSFISDPRSYPGCTRSTSAASWQAVLLWLSFSNWKQTAKAHETILVRNQTFPIFLIQIAYPPLFSIPYHLGTFWSGNTSSLIWQESLVQQSIP